MFSSYIALYLQMSSKTLYILHDRVLKVNAQKNPKNL